MMDWYGSTRPAWVPTGSCPHCSAGGTFVIHYGPCPRVRAIEYFSDGAIKRVEFHGETPVLPSYGLPPGLGEAGYISPTNT